MIADTGPKSRPFGSFDPPSTAKLVILSVASLGFYQMYWLYSCWAGMNETGYKKTIPWLRVLLYPLFALSCFRWIESVAARDGLKTKWSAGFLFSAFFILTCCSLLPNPYGLLSLLNFVPMITANLLAVYVNERDIPGYEPDNAYPFGDYAIITLGVVFYVLVWGCSYAMNYLLKNAPGYFDSISPDMHQLLLSIYGN